MLRRIWLGSEQASLPAGGLTLLRPAMGPLRSEWLGG